MKMNSRWTRHLALIVVLCASWLALPACDSSDKTPQPAGQESAAQAPAPSQAGGDASIIVARIGDISITDAELTESASADLKRIEAQIYKAKRKALDSLVEERLLAAAAKEKGVTVDVLIETEVDAKVEEPTEEDTKKFYDENKNRLRGEYETVKPRVTQFLTTRAKQEQRETFMKSLKADNKVTILMEAPKIKVEIGDAPVKGDSDAPITIVEFSDYECPFCRRSQATLDEVKEKYKGKLRFVFKDFPLGFHRRAKPAASASRCAAEQGKYWEFHDKLFSGKGLTDENFKTYAEELSLDQTKFSECVEADRFQAQITADMNQGKALGVTGTPAFFVNGRFLSGAQPLKAFSDIIDEELEQGGAS